ncbi:MAG: type II methionyl aminopeptidase [Acidilobaceae archaeon]
MELDVSKLKQAGSVAASVRRYAEKLVKPGAKASHICEELERMIVELGGLPAFPCNISVNEIAAHYTPSIGDDVVIGEKDLVKIDIGVHVDGYIADTATTIDLGGECEDLIEASQRALEVAISVIKPYVSVYEIGKAIENEIKKRGFRPIKNLSGHTIERFVLHAGISIPNHADRTLFGMRLTPGTLVAIEPFATNGRGLVVEKSTINIYSYVSKKKVALSDEEEKVLTVVANRYRALPFTLRWLLDLNIEPARLKKIVESLYIKGVLKGYPVLAEAGGGLVSQAEHTVLIGEDDVLVTTK